MKLITTLEQTALTIEVEAGKLVNTLEQGFLEITGIEAFAEAVASQELREDGGLELREDGGIELRD